MTSKPPVNLEELKKKYRKEIEEIPVPSDEDEIEFKIERVGKLIEYSIDRVDYYEAVRTRHFTFAISLLGFGIAVLAFVTPFMLENISFALPILVVVFPPILVLITTGLFTIHKSLDQTNYDYSYRNVAKSPWYYFYKVPNFSGLGQEYPAVDSPKELADAYFGDLIDNIEKRVGESKQDALKADIEQLVLLYVITGYKRRFSTETKKMLARGVKYSLWILLFAIASYSIIYLILFYGIPWILSMVA